MEKQRFKSKISYLLEENTCLKQELIKIKDENKILNKKFDEFLNASGAINNSFASMNQSNR